MHNMVFWNMQAVQKETEAGKCAGLSHLNQEGSGRFIRPTCYLLLLREISVCSLLLRKKKRHGFTQITASLLDLWRGTRFLFTPQTAFHCWTRTTSNSTECSHHFLLLHSLQTKIPHKFTSVIRLVGSEVTVLLFWSLTPWIECSFLLLNSASLVKAIVLGRHVTELPQNQDFVYFCSSSYRESSARRNNPHLPTAKATSTPVSISGPLPHLYWTFPGFSPSVL